jgi:hypothetical protein
MLIRLYDALVPTAAMQPIARRIVSLVATLAVAADVPASSPPLVRLTGLLMCLPMSTIRDHNARYRRWIHIDDDGNDGMDEDETPTRTTHEW